MEYFNDEVLGEGRFRVSDKKEREVKVGVSILERGGKIKDYYNVGSLWEKVGGGKWCYVGERYGEGSKWDFENKDVEMWGEEGGVRVEKNGGVIGLCIGDFNGRGEVGDVIGEFREVESVGLGRENDKLGGGENGLGDLKGGLSGGVVEEVGCE